MCVYLLFYFTNDGHNQILEKCLEERERERESERERKKGEVP